MGFRMTACADCSQSPRCVGPRGVLTTGACVGFESRTMQPDERATDMAPRTGRHQDIESLRADCVPR